MCYNPENLGHLIRVTASHQGESFFMKQRRSGINAVLGGDFPHATGLCLLSFALVRVTYTLLVNLHATFEPGVDVAAFGVIMSVLGSSSRFAVDAIAVAVSGRVKVLGEKGWLVLTATALLVCGAVFETCAANGWFGGMAVFVVGAIFVPVGYELLLLLWHEFLVGLDFKTVKRLVLWKIGFDAVSVSLVFASPSASFVLCVVLPVVGGACLLNLKSHDVGSARSQKPWLRFKPKEHISLALGVFLLGMGFSFAQTAFHGALTGEAVQQAGPVADVAGRFATLFVMLAFLKALSDSRFELLFKGAALVSIIGFLFLFLPFAGSFFCFKTFIVVAAFLLEYAVLLATVYVAGYSLAPPIRIIAWGQLIMRVAGLVSMIVGLVLSPYLATGDGASILPYVVAIEIVLLAFAGMWLIRDQTMTKFLWGRGSVALGESGRPDDDASSKVARIAANHGLTEREREILLMLVEGRSIPYIKETLYISGNTVKTHVRHIYQKTCVHDRQELIDLFQGVERP